MRYLLRFVCVAILGLEHFGGIGLSITQAQDTVDELLELAGPKWELLRQQNYHQIAMRVEEFKEHRSLDGNENRRTRQSHDFFASGDLKLIRRTGTATVTNLEPTELPQDSEAISFNVVTAQNSRYGFQVHRKQDEQQWNMRQLKHWEVVPSWRWLMNPLPNMSPVDEILMRGLSLDPRLGVGASDSPFDLLCAQMKDRNVVGELTQRVADDGQRIVVAKWTNTVSEVVPDFAEKGAVRSRVIVRVDLLPEQDWQLLEYEMRAAFLDNSDQSLGTYHWSKKIEYKPNDGAWIYRISSIEDASRGLIKSNRFIRLLTDEETAHLKTLCQLSGFGLPEPTAPIEDLP